eukprot:8578130-Pyramimonas_sp.AAC.1
MEVSDHAAQSCSFSQRSAKPEEYRKIPRHIFESEAFQDLLDTVTRQLDFTPRSLPRQIELSKWAVKEVAREIRDRFLRCDSEALGSQLLPARQISRAVWRNDVSLAVRLRAANQTARDFVDISSGTVSLVHDPSFQQWSEA